MSDLIAMLEERATFEDARVLEEAQRQGFVPEVYNGSQTGALLREAAAELRKVREAMRKIYGAVIRALAAIVNVNTPDKLFDLDAIPNAPVMEQVMVIRAQMDKLSALAQQPAAVDGDSPYPAPRNRQEAAALARLALAYLGVTSAHIDAVVSRCETDLAGQQGGSDNDR